MNLWSNAPALASNRWCWGGAPMTFVRAILAACRPSKTRKCCEPSSRCSTIFRRTSSGLPIGSVEFKAKDCHAGQTFQQPAAALGRAMRVHGAGSMRCGRLLSAWERQRIGLSGWTRTGQQRLAFAAHCNPLGIALPLDHEIPRALKGANVAQRHPRPGLGQPRRAFKEIQTGGPGSRCEQ